MEQDYAQYAPLKVRTHNETVTPLLLREANLLWHILEKSTNLSWAVYRMLEERVQGNVTLPQDARILESTPPKEKKYILNQLF